MKCDFCEHNDAEYISVNTAGYCTRPTLDGPRSVFWPLCYCSRCFSNMLLSHFTFVPIDSEQGEELMQARLLVELTS